MEAEDEEEVEELSFVAKCSQRATILKQFDDDEWIRSLTEAQEITADLPEDSVMCGQQAC